MRKLVLATGNPGKIFEFKTLLHNLPLELMTVQDYPGLVMPEEDRTTFAENAAKKAEVVSQFTGEMALADDSGLQVDALGGLPGVRSARFAGPDGDYRANNNLLLEKLKGLASPDRKAHFVCVIALTIPGSKTRIVKGTCSGQIAEYPRGEGGFGYDPLFIYEPAGVTFAEMDIEEKNKVSHRGKALRQIRDLLEQLL